jgi:hypothetical protein
VDQAISEVRGAVPVRLDRRAGQVVISADPLSAPSGPVRVQLVRFVPKAQVMIETGENAGRLVDYANVVTSWSLVGAWDGVAPLSMTAEATGPEGVVVILQAEGDAHLPGRILGAAQSN